MRIVCEKIGKFVNTVFEYPKHKGNFIIYKLYTTTHFQERKFEEKSWIN